MFRFDACRARTPAEDSPPQKARTRLQAPDGRAGSEQARLLQELQDLRGALLWHFPSVRMAHHLRGDRRLVRIVHAGEHLDLATPRSRIDPLAIAAFADLDRGIDVDLDE